MISTLPINIDDLLHFHGVESARVELKQSWDEKTTGLQVLKTICAFANDFYNVNGGYIIIGVGEHDSLAALPPLGLSPKMLNAAQKWIRGNRLEPNVQLRLSPEVVDGKHILVVWVPGSDARPHQAPSGKNKQRAYFIREGSETIEAKGKLLTDLLNLCAKIPFDDRRASQFTLLDLRSILVREFLSDVGSGLIEETDDYKIYRHLWLTAKTNGHEVPKNLALLFFMDNPEIAFRGARIEVVHFPDDGYNVLHEWTFRGPLPKQIKDCVNHLEHFSTTFIQKHDDRYEASRWVSFPLAAIKETIVNAVYHRSYEGTPEPTKVYIYPDRLEVTSYPGPVPGLKKNHFEQQKVPSVPARNRRIGEMLKELKLAEARGTGIRKVFRAMVENGSPPPRYEFNEERTYFTVILPAHPDSIRT
jgi:ATP-dependent DNA helicase RecG